MAAPPPLLLLGVLLGLSAARAPAAKASAAPTVQVTVGVLLPEDLRLPWALQRVAPALSLALEALQPQLRLDGLAVRIAFASSKEDGGCEEEASLFRAAELKGSHDPDVLLGLGCFRFGFLLESFVRFWRLPLLVAGSYPKSSGVSEVVYAGPLGRSLPAFQARLNQHFNWTCPVLMAFSLVMDSMPYYDFSWEAKGYGRDPGRPDVSVFTLNYEEPGEAVGHMQVHGRVPSMGTIFDFRAMDSDVTCEVDALVAFICGLLEELHQILHLAHAQNMTNGDYVFFYLDPFGESLRAKGHRQTAKPWQSKEINDTGGLQEAFQTVLVVTPHEPQTLEYRRFENELVLRAQRDFGVAINDSRGHLMAGYFHDGLLLYLRALSETLRKGGTKQNTSHILENMRNLKIQGVTGTMSINSDNDQEMDFDLWAMRDVETGEYQVVAHYIASEDRINWTGDILWKKGAPPLDSPPCVFDQDDPTSVEHGNDNLMNLGSTFFRRSGRMKQVLFQEADT